jgi:hypothetical protein
VNVCHAHNKARPGFFAYTIGGPFITHYDPLTSIRHIFLKYIFFVKRNVFSFVLIIKVNNKTIINALTMRKSLIIVEFPTQKFKKIMKRHLPSTGNILYSKAMWSKIKRKTLLALPTFGENYREVSLINFYSK